MKPYDPWNAAPENIQAPEGASLRCSGKTGLWTLDGAAIDIGRDGLNVAVIMPTGLHGQLRFENGAFGGRKPIRYEDAPPPVDEQLQSGWSPLTEVLCVATDPGHVGQLLTYTGSSWGARRAFERLIKPYVRKGRKQFPVCELGSRERGNVNGNFEPLLIPIDWVSADRFPDLLPPPAPIMLVDDRQEQPLSPPPLDEAPPIDDDNHNLHSRAIEDDIPF